MSHRALDAAVEVPVGPHRQSADVWIVDPGGSRRVKVGTFPGPDRYRFETSDMPRDLGRDLVHASGEERIYVGWADAHSILVLSANGEPVAQIGWAGRSLELTDALWREWVEDRIATIPPQFQQRDASFLRTAPKPTQFPAYRRFLVDSHEHLWVEEYPRPNESEGRWSVFDPEGSWLGTVWMPERLHVYEIHSDAIIGAWLDPDDVPYAVIYPLRRSP